MSNCIATACLLIGLLATAVGAGITARAVIIGDEDAMRVSTTMWGSNPAFKKSLVDQSKSAQIGLLVIVAGTVLQMIGTALPLIWRR